MDASIWGMFISKDRDTLEIVRLTLLSSFPSMDFISGQLISLTNPIHRIQGQFVNKLQILFCDRALLKLHEPTTSTRNARGPQGVST